MLYCRSREILHTFESFIARHQWELSILSERWRGDEKVAEVVKKEEEEGPSANVSLTEAVSETQRNGISRTLSWSFLVSVGGRREHLQELNRHWGSQGPWWRLTMLAPWRRSQSKQWSTPARMERSSSWSCWTSVWRLAPAPRLINHIALPSCCSLPSLLQSNIFL